MLKGSVPPYSAGLYAAWLADEAESAAGNLTRWRDNTSCNPWGAQDGSVHPGRDWFPYPARVPTVVTGSSPDGRHTGIAVDPASNQTLYQNDFWKNAAHDPFTEMEAFFAIRCDAAAGVAGVGVWYLGNSGDTTVMPFVNEHIYDDAFYNVRPDMGIKGTEVRAGCIYNVRVTAGNVRNIMVNDVDLFTDNGGAFTMRTQAFLGSEGVGVSWKGTFFGALWFTTVLPNAAARTSVARWLDRRCGMGVGI
jgi:hypothetical protein